MASIDAYRQAFVTALQIEESRLEGLEYQAVPTWDSVGHMALVTELEDAFDIMMDTDDILDLSSFEKGKEILGRYGVEF